MTAKISPRTLIEIEERSAEGAREMAAARLNLRAVTLINSALTTCGISQKELADRVGVGESRVSQILHSDGNIKISTLARYLRAMGYSATIEAVPVDSSVSPLPPKRVGRRSKLIDGDEIVAIHHTLENNGQFGEAIMFTKRDHMTGSIVSSTVLGVVNPENTRLHLQNEWNNLDTRPLELGAATQ